MHTAYSRTIHHACVMIMLQRHLEEKNDNS